MPVCDIRRLDDINVHACACDSLYRTITIFFYFLLSYSDDLYMSVKLSAVLSNQNSMVIRIMFCNNGVFYPQINTSKTDLSL